MSTPTTPTGQRLAGFLSDYTDDFADIEAEAATAERERLRARNRDDIARFLAGMDAHELASRALLHDYADWLLADPEPA